jgi:hypothetical protein
LWQKPSWPHKRDGYKPVDFRALRETGASWKMITEGTPKSAGDQPQRRQKTPLASA